MTTCRQIETRLLESTAGGPAPGWSAGERLHLERCRRCREAARGADAIPRDGGGRRPGPLPGDPYWTTILPRVRSRTAGAPVPAPLRALMPVAAGVFAALLLVAVASGPAPEPVAGPGRTVTQALAALSEEELRELRGTTGWSVVLDPAGWNGAAWSPLAEVLDELVAEDHDAALRAAGDPAEMLRAAGGSAEAEVIAEMQTLIPGR